jgi:SAM-dependent methyltransferase
MRAFWDARAREEPYFFIDDRRTYGDETLDGFWREGERDLDRLLELLGVAISPRDDVLEIGCGVGRLTRPIAARARQVHALDISAEMIERARKHHPTAQNIHWLVNDGRSLAPVGDRAVDLVISHVVFQHIPDPRITLGYVTEMGRTLRPGGRAAFQVSGDPRIHRPRGGLRERLRRAAASAGRAPRGRDDPAWLGSAVTVSEVRAAAAGGGLEIELVVGEGTQFCLIAAVKPPLAEVPA